MQLDELMAFHADVVLEFSDGTLPANSTLLGMHSSVLRGACEAASPGAARCADAAPSSTTKRPRELVIPVPGLTKQDWLTAAPFLYPVVPEQSSAAGPSWRCCWRWAALWTSTCCCMRQNGYLTTHAYSLEPDEASPHNIWRWLHLADKAGLQRCIGPLTTHAAMEDRASCMQLSKLQLLSLQVLQTLTMAIAAKPAEGSKRSMVCSHCPVSGGSQLQFSFGAPAAANKPQTGCTLAWVCDRCRRAD